MEILGLTSQQMDSLEVKFAFDSTIGIPTVCFLGLFHEFLGQDGARWMSLFTWPIPACGPQKLLRLFLLIQ